MQICLIRQAAFCCEHAYQHWPSPLQMHPSRASGHLQPQHCKSQKAILRLLSYCPSLHAWSGGAVSPQHNLDGLPPTTPSAAQARSGSNQLTSPTQHSHPRGSNSTSPAQQGRQQQQNPRRPKTLAELLQQPDTPGSAGTPMARDLQQALARLASDKKLMLQVSQ